MKKLVTITVLGVALSLSSTSYATDFMSLYTEPVAKSEVVAEIKGADVEGGHMSLYLSSKEEKENTTTSIRAGAETSDDTTYIVFGVQIPRTQRG